MLNKKVLIMIALAALLQPAPSKTASGNVFDKYKTQYATALEQANQAIANGDNGGLRAAVSSGKEAFNKLSLLLSDKMARQYGITNTWVRESRSTLTNLENQIGQLKAPAAAAAPADDKDEKAEKAKPARIADNKVKAFQDANVTIKVLQGNLANPSSTIIQDVQAAFEALDKIKATEKDLDAAVINGQLAEDERSLVLTGLKLLKEAKATRIKLDDALAAKALADKAKANKAKADKAKADEAKSARIAVIKNLLNKTKALDVANPTQDSLDELGKALDDFKALGPIAQAEVDEVTKKEKDARIALKLINSAFDILKEAQDNYNKKKLDAAAATPPPADADADADKDAKGKAATVSDAELQEAIRQITLERGTAAKLMQVALTSKARSAKKSISAQVPPLTKALTTILSVDPKRAEEAGASTQLIKEAQQLLIKAGAPQATAAK